MPCPNRAAWESPMTAATGTPAGNRPSCLVNPNCAFEGRTSARTERGTPKAASSSSSQARRLMSNSCVRDAFEASVANTSPPVRFHRSNESTVPTHRSPAADRDRSGSCSSSSHRNFVAEVSGSNGRPVRASIIGARPAARASSHKAAVRRHCQLITGPTGRPVARSQAAVDSRWFVTATAARSTDSPAASRHRSTATVTPVHSASASDSTQPGCGYRCSTGAEARATTRPDSSTRIAFEFVVPWSIASICDISSHSLASAQGLHRGSHRPRDRNDSAATERNRSGRRRRVRRGCAWARDVFAPRPPLRRRPGRR
jgi:hypothetical protein